MRKNATTESALVPNTRGEKKWVYEMNIWTNPTVLGTCAKVFSIAAAGPVVLMLLITWHEDGFVTLPAGSRDPRAGPPSGSCSARQSRERTRMMVGSSFVEGGSVHARALAPA